MVMVHKFDKLKITKLQIHLLYWISRHTTAQRSPALTRNATASPNRAAIHPYALPPGTHPHRAASRPLKVTIIVGHCSTAPALPAVRTSSFLQ
jgi:hypothetical protein